MSNYWDTFIQVMSYEGPIAGAVLLVILLAVAWAIVARRARRGKKPNRTAKNTILEGTYAAVLLGGAITLIVFTAAANEQNSKPPPRVGTDIDVTAFQWCWQFRYPQHPITVTGSCVGDANTPTIVVPVGEPIKLHLTSSDVIHSFWVPALAVKMDAFPDHVNTIAFTVDKPGEWEGHCAEFCGVRHALMRFHLKAVPRQQYQQWLQSQGQPA